MDSLPDPATGWQIPSKNPGPEGPPSSHSQENALISAFVGATTAGLLLGGVAFALDRTALAMIRPPQKVRGRAIEALPFRARVHSFSSLGQPLKGWMLEPERDQGRAVAVLAHGWGSSHARMTRLALPLLEAGYPVFLFDVRHHGEAPDAPFVTARHFRDDILAATREVAELYPSRPRVLIGHSMGGSCGILAVAEGAPVHGLVTIAAPADLWEVWAHFFERKGLPGRLMVRVFSPFWRARAGVPFETLRPEVRVKELAKPLLILHGSKDESVPAYHARILAAAAGVDPIFLEGENHSDLLGGPGVVQEVLTFLEECSTAPPRFLDPPGAPTLRRRPRG
jgi:pimeloyl-ACP methyl ester carboxylesterase